MTYKDPGMQAYAQHKGNAKSRGIPFRLTLDEWFSIWTQSERLALRGNRKGRYIMARFGDKGAYEVGNVKIILFEDNIREAKIGKPRPDVARRNKERYSK